MRILLPLLLSLVSMPVLAYPVTYLFSATVTFAKDGLGLHDVDPGTPLFKDGQMVLTGNTVAFGNFTFDAETSKYNRPGQYPGVDRTHLIVDLWGTLQWTMSAEGYTLTGGSKGGNPGLFEWIYSDEGFSARHEGGTGANSPFTRFDVDFNFAPPTAPHGDSDYLLTENFTGGTFEFFFPSVGDAPSVWWVGGTIDALTRVPEPASGLLFGIGVAGLALTRRRASAYAGKP